MATCKTGVLSPFSGQVGPVVGAVLKTLNVIRKRPGKSSKPPKQSQVDQRSKFATAMEFVRGQSDTFRLGYKMYTGIVGPLNVAARHLLKDAITGVSPDFKLDYPKIVFSKGKLVKAMDLEMTALPQSTMKFEWSLDLVKPALLLERGKDKCYAVMYSEALQMAVTSDGIFTRSELSFELKAPRAFIGKTVHVWFFFSTEDGEQVSDSLYLGSEILLA